MDNKAESDAAEKNTSKRFTTWLGAITVAMSILAGVVTYFSYHLARQAHYYEQETSRRRFILDTLKEMQQVQENEKRSMQSRSNGSRKC